ncbi:hypothetical protein [Streptomyces violascens]|uniref:hypothetical protein n=1 Tax=Streptomyces violascens TaxID=67381 RepID=UPI00365F88ED
MILSREFLDRYVEIQRESERTRVHHAAVDLGLWQSFVATCESGYDNSLYEYMYDLQVRDAIETALSDTEISETEGYSAFKEKVRVIDEKFRRIATQSLPVKDSSGSKWWHLVIPYRGCEEFANNLREEFGVTIEIIPEDY